VLKLGFQNKSDKKGFGFEYTVSDMFQNQGYLTRRGIPLQYGNGNYDATDIDVLGIMFTSPFQGHRIISDCKNKVRSKPYERIFWAKGLGEFVKASNVYVAMQKTQWEIIRFASTGGVKVLTSDILEEYVDSDRAYGLADASFYASFERDIEKVAKNNSKINYILSNVKRLFVAENPYVAINVALAHLDEISRWQTIPQMKAKELQNTLKYLISQLTVIVGLQILWICSDVLGLPERARKEHITSKLTFGDLEPNAVRGILDNARDLANELVKSSVPKSVAPKEVDFGEITPPHYTQSLIGLVERALQRPQTYITLPQTLDFVLFEQGIKSKVYTDDELKEILGYSSQDEKMKASRNILAFVREYCGIDWKGLWSSKTVEKQPLKSDVEIDNPVNTIDTEKRDRESQNKEDLSSKVDKEKQKDDSNNTNIVEKQPDKSDDVRAEEESKK
jgi:hypothetical protein